MTCQFFRLGLVNCCWLIVALRPSQTAFVAYFSSSICSLKMMYMCGVKEHACGCISLRKVGQREQKEKKIYDLHDVNTNLVEWQVSGRYK